MSRLPIGSFLHSQDFRNLKGEVPEIEERWRIKEEVFQVGSGGDPWKPVGPRGKEEPSEHSGSQRSEAEQNGEPARSNLGRRPPALGNKSLGPAMLQEKRD
ncbi:hypothetical protein NDU88_000005 [Pleurodeles waltl]|uniref:Uncharacterized protein n=1 Tax=Pleurodeles waltl TaxID=8319 RepID=A0AAV7S8W8_PLEWA|nr:hypothetical protein NDU88_000005 [Pleurodeles waltl]